MPVLENILHKDVENTNIENLGLSKYMIGKCKIEWQMQDRLSIPENVVLKYIGWQWRNFAPYLCQLVFAAILWVKFLEMFVTVLSSTFCWQVNDHVDIS